MSDDSRFPPRLKEDARSACQHSAILILARHLVRAGAVSAGDLASEFTSASEAADEAFGWDNAGTELRLLAEQIRNGFGVKPPLRVVPHESEDG